MTFRLVYVALLLQLVEKGSHGLGLSFLRQVRHALHVGVNVMFLDLAIHLFGEKGNCFIQLHLFYTFAHTRRKEAQKVNSIVPRLDKRLVYRIA
jgi:hypothetical protein